MKRFAPVLVLAGVLALLLIGRVAFVRTPPSGAPDQTDGAAGSPAAPELQFVNIGTGGVTGVYYQVGAAIMKLVNAKEQYNIKVSFQPTGGSVYNINAVLAGDLDLGVAQSDRQYQALKGLAEWQDRGPQAQLRAVCSVHPESVTLIAADDSGIQTVADLKGKRVNIGNPGSGNRGNAMDVLRTAGIDWEKDLHAEGVKGAESAKLLQDGRIDAFFYTVGHPAGAITEATAGRRKVRFIPITGMEELLSASPYYAAATIPAKLYPKATNERDTQTVGVMTTLITSAAVPEPVIYAITREIFENLDAFRDTHPAFAGLTAQGMISKGISAPFHPGAVRYYREAGLMQP